MSRRAVRPLDPEARREANRQIYARHPERDPARGGSGIHPTAREDAALRREWMDYYEAAGGAVETVPRRRRAERMVAPCCDSWIHFIVMDQETERRLPEVLIFLRLPNGEERLVETNAQGEALIENIPSGNCTILTFDSPDLIPVLEQIQDLDFSVQRVVMPAETSTQDEPPTQEEPSEETEESTEPETTLSVRSLLLHPCADYHVQRGDDLEAVASVGGFDTIGELLGFNFGRLGSPDEVQHALNVHIGVNEDSYDDDGNLVFSGNEDPGVFYYPLHDDSEHATEQVHIIKVQAVRRRSPLELETVDELGQHRPSQQLQLVPTCGEPIPIETDDNGYWSTGDEPIEIGGLLEVQLRDGTVLHFPDQGQFRDDVDRPPAVVNPMLVFSAVTTIVVPRLDETRRTRRASLRRRYEEVSDERLRPGQAPEEESQSDVSEEESPSMQPRRRRFRNAVDNVWIEAGWGSGEEPDIGALHDSLSSFLRDYHPTTFQDSRRFYAEVVSGQHVWFINPQGDVEGRFELRDEFRFANFGGFIAVERSSGEAPFLDMVEQAYGMSRALVNGEVTSVSDMNEEERRRYQYWPGMIQPDQQEAVLGLQRRYARHVQVLYILPSSEGMWTVMARHGGCGFLEEYPDPDENADLFDRIHERNLNVIRNVERAYNGYLRWYQDQVEGIPDRVRAAGDEEDARGRSVPFPARCEWALRQLGPPDSPFRFPMPATLDREVDRERRALGDLAEANSRASSFDAWMTISDFLDEIWHRQSGGSIRFVVDFEGAPGARMHLGPDIHERAGDVSAGAQAGYSRYAQIKFKTNVSLDPNQGLLLPGEEDIINIDETEIGEEIGADASIRRGSEVVLGGTAQVTRATEIEVSTRDYKNTVKFDVGLTGGGRSIGIKGELSDNGDYKVVVPSIIGDLRASGNVEDGSTRVGVCWSRDTRLATHSSLRGSASATAEGKICLGVRIQLLRTDTVLAVVSNAPGFFERIGWEDIVRPGRHWNHLTEDMQECLYTLGWTNPDVWDRRHDLQEREWPEIPRTRWVDLEPEQHVAAIHLGMHRMQDNVRQSWTYAWGRIHGYPGIRPQDAEAEAAGDAAAAADSAIPG